MQVLHYSKDNTHQFFIKNKTLRNTIDAVWEKKLNKTGRLTLKGNISFYNRDITTNVFGMKGHQRSYYTELTYFIKSGKHNIVTGANVSGEKFDKKYPDSTMMVPYRYTTAGFFIQDDWKISPKFITQKIC